MPGGNAKTAIICAVTPAAMSEEQTVSTLRFATQAKSIKNHAQVNEVLDDAAKINRMKKEMAALKAELEAARVQSVGNREAELQEALDEATREKENLLVRVLDANEKILTSTQAAPPRKSMMPKKNKVRRETWCGPAMRKNMRMSMFQRPLVPLAPLSSAFETDFTLEKNTRANSNSSFQMTSNKSFEQDLGAVEKQRLEELDEEEEQLEDSVFPEMLPVPVSDHLPKKRTGTVTFATSPAMFASPLRKRQKEDVLNLTDGGTPKVKIHKESCWQQYQLVNFLFPGCDQREVQEGKSPSHQTRARAQCLGARAQVTHSQF